MPLGIRPIVDFAFKKTFGSPENEPALVSLLNAILDLPSPIESVTIINPYSIQDFQEDKLSILDVKAVDRDGAIFNVEMQLTVVDSVVQRLVFYGCEIYAGQLKSGIDYKTLKPVYSICLVDGKLWRDSPQVHHAFRLTDQKSGRTLTGTIEIHTLELGKYNLLEANLAKATALDCWLYWLLHAQEYEPETLIKLFPQQAIQLATRTLTRIRDITEDKVMYDVREKAIRDYNYGLLAKLREGEAIGEAKGIAKEQRRGAVKILRMLQDLCNMPLSTDQELQSLDVAAIEAKSEELRQYLRDRK